MNMKPLAVAAKQSPSLNFIRRMRSFYVGKISTTPDDSEIWRMVASRQKPIHDALLESDEAALAVLSDPAATNLYLGVDNLAADIVGAEPDFSSWSSSARSELLILAVALGVKTAFNPFGGSKYPDCSHPPEPDTETLLADIEAKTELEIIFPNPFGAEPGVETSRGIASHRAIQALYQAYLAKSSGCRSCLEIGAGMGRTAFYMHKSGIAVTIIDLPMTLIGQALFLSHTVGESGVWFDGEETVGDSPAIRLFAPDAIDRIGGVDLVLNVDSLTEMGEASAAAYLAYSARSANALISVNHEANHFTVADLMPKAMRRTVRAPYWFRSGYVEEHFAALG